MSESVKCFTYETLPKKNGSRKIRINFSLIDCDGRVRDVSKAEFFGSNLPLAEVSEYIKGSIFSALGSQLSMGELVSINMWANEKDRSLLDVIEKYLQSGAKWTKRGIVSGG